MIVDESRAQVARAEVGVVEDRAVVGNRRCRSDHHEFAQGAARSRDRLGAVAAVDYELGDEGVVVRRHVRTGPEA